MITPEWVKLIPADSIPVFCFPADILHSDLEYAREYLTEFFGERKFLVIRSNEVQIFAIANSASVSTEGAAWAMEGAK